MPDPSTEPAAPSPRDPNPADSGTVQIDSRVAEQLAIESERYAALVMSSDDAIVSKSLDGVIESWNPAAERIFGYTAREVIGQPVLMLFPEDRAHEEADILARVARGERVEHFETVRLHKNGSRITLSVTISPIRDGHGTIVGASKIARDIGERRRIERVQSEFLANVNHELRTPLTAISAAVKLIAHSLPTMPDATRELVEVADRNCDRLALLIDDLLELAALDAGGPTLVSGPIDLVRAVPRALRELAGIAEARDVAVDLQTSLTEAPARCDERSLDQIISNLVSNAVKFSPPGGNVEIRIDESLPGMFRVSVLDRGPGIEPDFRPFLFDRFAQGDGSSTRANGGTGLGLSIAKGLVERHNGRIEFETEVGQGTVFHVDLLAHDEQP